MKEIIIFFPIALLYAALKGTLFASIPLPDVPLLMVFYAAYRRPSVEGVLLAFVLGYMEDVLGGGIIGSASFALIAVFLAAHLLAKKVQFSTRGTRAGGAFAAVLIKGALVYTVIRLSNLTAHILTDVLIQAVVTAVFAPAILTLTARLALRLAPAPWKGDAS
ncbi:MAG: rod shape-determining protein MreD [Deltaproteobacteria bacterium]|nr:rod shape-determining protein MreD [Deltaproteobacteria bacterium]